MKRGFTILELLVASLLLGMLVTILTMIFNQSSIAWRTGVAGVADLDDARANMAELRDELQKIPEVDAFLEAEEELVHTLQEVSGELSRAIRLYIPYH